MLTVLGTAAGILFGVVTTYLVARRVTHRPRLSIRLQPTLILWPDDLDVHDRLTFSVGGKPVANICALELEVSCRGQKDIAISDAGPDRPPNATPMPRIDFHDFRIIGIQTLNNDASRFYIPLGRHNRGVYLNIHRLRAGATARFQIVGELSNAQRDFDVTQSQLFPGAIPDIDLTTSGLIQRPWLKA